CSRRALSNPHVNVRFYLLERTMVAARDRVNPKPHLYVRLTPASRLTYRLINHEVKSTMSQNLDTTFAALADPTRRAILARLAHGEVSVTELAAPFEMSLPAISKHLKVLERAGLIVRGRDAQWRPCRLDARPLQEAAAYIDK